MAVERRSDKHAPRLDEQLESEVRPEIHSGHPSRADEYREPEPEGDDQAAPYPRGGPPPGVVGEDLSPEQVALRSELARHLDRGTFPANREALMAGLNAHRAPDPLIEAVGQLPANRSYHNLDEAVHALQPSGRA
ncbi:MAG: DUF2795 domain-containing protein [Streptomycetaceae bacterium]|nr:DUF2795 domain-containing protein [Streptomycetaceae bacterium]